jgi:putative tryptophan/tyrosine transport system substrate-binding protein
MTLGLLAAPLVAEAQSAGKVYRIAVLGATRPEDLPQWEGFRQGLRERGYVEGQNIAIDYRWAQGRFERLPALAAELAGLKPTVIVAFVTQSSVAARKATSTIPIVMVAVADPIGAGLVPSLARPGGATSLAIHLSLWRSQVNRSSSSRRSLPSVGAWQFSGTRRTRYSRIRW